MFPPMPSPTPELTIVVAESMKQGDLFTQSDFFIIVGALLGLLFVVGLVAFGLVAAFWFVVSSWIADS